MARQASIQSGTLTAVNKDDRDAWRGHWWQKRPSNPLLLALVRTVRNPMGAFGLVILLILVAVSLAAPLLAPFDPLEQHRRQTLLSPSSTYLLGTDGLGRDILSRIIYGSRISLGVGVIAVALGASIGIAAGLLSGYFGGLTDVVIMRGCDAVLAFPSILLGIAVITVLGPGALNVAIALAIANVPQFSRLTRSCVMGERERDYVHAARCLGGSDTRIMVRHVLPNCLGPLLVQLSLTMGFAVMAEAGLSFLGLGTQPPDASWGSMLNDSRQYLREAPWYGISPGIALALLLLALNYLSDALHEALDPRRINIS